MIHSRTRSVDLFRLMYATGRVDESDWTDEQRAAHVEWDRRLEACRSEWGTCYDRERRYEAYCDGREDEKRIRGDDLRIAKVLYDAIEDARRMVARSVPGGPYDRLSIALRSLTAADIIRLNADD